MKPILKWAGGKTSELPVIKDHAPKNFNRLVEPFLGGGAFYFNSEHGNNIVNDVNKELICFYQLIKDQNSLLEFSKIIDIANFERNTINQVDSLDALHSVCQTVSSDSIFVSYLNRELRSKDRIIARVNIKKAEKSLPPMSEQEILLNKKTAAMAALYYMYRDRYNLKNKALSFDIEHIAYWFIMREICYSGMFRFSSKGNFNVPYGGISYNNKKFSTKLEHIRKMSALDFYQNTDFNNLDFDQLFEKYDNFKEDDFIFLDPPYDSDFSQYNKEADFTLDDHKRLRDRLLKTKAKFMMIIKETLFIKELYSEHFFIDNFDKSYSVNFRNRNDRDVNHLIIRNYR